MHGCAWLSISITAVAGDSTDWAKLCFDRKCPSPLEPDALSCPMQINLVSFCLFNFGPV